MSDPATTIDPAVVKQAEEAFKKTLADVRDEYGQIEKRLNERIESLEKLRGEDLEKHEKMTADLDAQKKRADELEVAMQKAVASKNAAEENKTANDGWHNFSKRYRLHEEPELIKAAGIEGEAVAAYAAYASAFRKALRLAPEAAEFFSRGGGFGDASSDKFAWTTEEQKAVKAFKIISKAFTGGTDAGGALLLPEVEEANLERQLWLVNPIRQYARVTQVGTREFKRLFMRGNGGTGWVGETASRPETTTPTLTEVQVNVGQIYAFPFASEDNIDDARYDVASITIEEASRMFGVQEATAFTNGDGTNKPKGILQATLTTGESDETRELTEFDQTSRATAQAKANLLDDMLTLYKKLAREYRHNSKWFMNRSTASDLYGIKGSDGHYVLQPVANSLEYKIFGYPIVEIDEFPDYTAAGAKYIAFGDMMRAYQIIDRQTMRVRIDTLTNKPYIGYYCTRRVGGEPIDGASLKFLVATA